MTLTLTLTETLPGWTRVRVSSLVSIGPAVWLAIRHIDTDRHNAFYYTDKPRRYCYGWRRLTLFTAQLTKIYDGSWILWQRRQGGVVLHEITLLPSASSVPLQHRCHVLCISLISTVATQSKLSVAMSSQPLVPLKATSQVSQPCSSSTLPSINKAAEVEHPL